MSELTPLPPRCDPRASELGLLAEVVAHAPGLFYRALWHSDGRASLLYVFPAAREIVGREPVCLDDEAADPLSRVHPEDLPRLVASRTQATVAVQRIICEYRLRTADGQWRWMRDSGTGRRLPNGDLLVDGQVLDIHECKTAFESVAQSEARYQSILAQASEAIILLDAQGRIVEANPAFYRYLGYAPAELLGRPMAEIMDPEELAQRPLRWAELANGEPLYAVRRIRRRDGSFLTTESHIRLISPGLYLIVARDHTERQRVQEVVAASEARYRLLFEHAGVAIALTDPEGRILDVNPQTCHLLGFSREELLGRNVEDVLPPSERERVPERRARVLGGELVRFECQVTRKDGAMRQLEVVAKLHPDGQVQFVSHDITERKLTELARRVNRQQLEVEVARRTAELRSLLLAVQDLYFRVRPDGTVVGYHVTDPRQLFVPPEQTLHRRISDVLPPAAARVLMEAVTQALARRTVVTVRVELPMDQGRRWYENRVAPIDESEVALVVRDVTEQVRLQEEARRHEAESAHFARLASMGEMAAGLAHQLNQPLTALVNYARGCVRRLESGTDDRTALIAAMQAAADQAQRAATVVQELCDFARRAKAEPTPVSLNQAVRRALEFLRTVTGVPPDLQVHFRAAADLPPVLAVAVRLEQVLLNLLRNAVEALQEAPARRGEVVVTTARQDAATACVTVRDNAASSPPVDLDQLFVPFYTTKPAGMGIGLPMARSIIESHGGRLWVQRNPDAGLTFCFTLPFAVAPGGVPDPGAPGVAAPLPGEPVDAP